MGRRPGIGWPAAAAAADPRLRFAVRAVYGKRTDEIAAWLDEAVEGAEVLVVQGGSTTSPRGCQVADAAENLSAMVRRGQELGLRVAVANVLPWNNGWPGAEAPIRELNAQIAALGAGAALSRDAGGPGGPAGCARRTSTATIRPSRATGASVS